MHHRHFLLDIVGLLPYFALLIDKQTEKIMPISEIVVLSFALAVDVFGIAFAYGLIIKNKRLEMMLRLALTCAAFQFAMPIIGYFCTSLVSGIIAKYNHLLVFAVFTLLGLNIIKEAVFENGETDVKSKKLDFKTTFMIGVATSIDALFSGSMIYLTSTPLIVASSIIGAGSFLLGIIGFNLNCCLKKIPEKYLQIFAGIILIGLGVKSLIFH